MGRHKNRDLRPTESELEILNILWKHKKATVRQVHEDLGEHKSSGYTTTLKLLQIMFEKKLVRRDERAKSHIYEAAITQEKTQTLFLGRMIQTLFGGSPSHLILQALGDHAPSQEELERIEEVIGQLKKQGR